MTVCNYFTLCQIGGNYSINLYNESHSYVFVRPAMTVMFRGGVRGEGSCLVYLLQIEHFPMNHIIPIHLKSIILIFSHAIGFVS